MASIPRFSTLSPEQDAAPVGMIVSPLISAVVNQFPNSETTVGAGIVIFGAVTAGVVAAVRSMDSDAAGFHAGFPGGVPKLVTFVVMTGTAVVWPLSRVAFFAFADGVVICLASMFDLGCG